MANIRAFQACDASSILAARTMKLYLNTSQEVFLFLPSYNESVMAQRVNIQLLRRSLLITLLFQVAWVVMGFLCIAAGVDVHWGLLVGNLLTLWVPTLFILLTRLSLSTGFQIGFGIFITASSLVGSALGVYGTIPNWDTVVHVYSGVLLAWFGFILTNKAEASVKKPFPIWFKYSVAFMTPLAFAALWEIYEYMSDTFLGTTMQAGGLTDTIIDMAAALVGAILALIVAALWFLKRRVY